jgi:hypothetical protein
MSAPLRIANCSGFYGDLHDAPRLLLEGPDPIDVLTGDYLAELTMLILWKSKRKDSTAGYATTFLRQMDEVLGTVLDRNISVVVNAGGLNPRGLAEDLRSLAKKLGRTVNVAVVEGDNLIQDLPGLLASGTPFTNLDTGLPFSSTGRQALSVNAYLGGFGIAEALRHGAQIVVTGRVTDAALVIGPAAFHHGWQRDDFDALAGALVAGHLIECGTQVTGGNYALFHELPDDRFPGFPIAEVAEDGSSVITKQPGTGGLVSVGTVTAQLLYEISDERYENPDVIADFSTVQLHQLGEDRVQVSTTKGFAPSGKLKVALNYEGGYRNQMSVILTGLDLYDKARRVRTMLFDLLGGEDQFDEVNVELVSGTTIDAPTNEAATGRLRIVVKGQDEQLVGRKFSQAVVALTLASVPGFFADTPPTGASTYGVYWPALIDATVVEHTVVLESGEVLVIAPAPVTGTLPERLEELDLDAGDDEPTTLAILGDLCGARSGDKGGNANVGIWAADDDVFSWMVQALDVDTIAELLGVDVNIEVRRTVFPKLRAINYVVVGILGEGVASSTRLDPQGKGLGEYLRSRMVDVPISLLSKLRQP